MKKICKKGLHHLEVIGEALDQIGYLSIPHIGIRDIIDILVVTFFFYKVLIWIKDTRTWALLKGVVIIIVYTPPKRASEMDIVD